MTDADYRREWSDLVDEVENGPMAEMAAPIITEQYKGYTITAWPHIPYPPYKDFYANAFIDRNGKSTGIGGVEGSTPAEAVAAAKRWVDQR